MLQPRNECRLAPKALCAERRGELRIQEFEGHKPVVLGIVGEKHPGHASAPDLALEAIGSSERRLKVASRFGRLHVVRVSGVRRSRT